MQAYQLKYLALAAAMTTTPFALRAQSESGADAEWNHIGLDTHLGFNIRARFMNQNASLGALPAPPSAGGDVNRTYSDGFVKVDSSGNQSGLTGNWGYQKSSQISGDNLLLHAGSVDGGTATSYANPSAGFELSYVRDLDHEDWGAWGLKFSFGYSSIDLQNSQPQSGTATLITDAYSLGGVQAPLAPYAGSFSGPGTLIGSTPTRSSSTESVVIAGNQSLDATLYDFRVGPNVDVKLTKDLALQLSGGLAWGIVDSTYSYSETLATSGGAISASGSSHDTSGLVGAYIDAGLAYRVWHSISVQAGVEFEYLGQFQQGISGHVAQLNLDQAIFLQAGVQWSF